MKSTHSLLALNSELTTSILESQAVLAQSTLTTGSALLTQHGSHTQNLSLTGALVAELLECGRNSVERTVEHVQQARPHYEQWAISNAGAFGEMMNTMAGLNHR